MEIVSSGCNAVYNVMAQCIRDHHANLIAARMGNAQISYNDPLNMVSLVLLCLFLLFGVPMRKKLRRT